MMRGLGGLVRGAQREAVWREHAAWCRLLTGSLSSTGPSQDHRRLLHTTPIRNEIVKSQFPDIKVPEMRLTDFVFKDFDKFGNRPALIDGVTGREVTFPQFREQVERVASGLTRAGFRKGDTLLIASPNCIEYVVLVHAVSSCGGITTMVNPLYPAADITRQTADSYAKFIVCSKDQVKKINEVTKTVGNIKVWVLDDGSQGHPPFSVLLEDDGSAHPGDVAINLREDACLMPYSSGTTGLPKGVLLTHYNEVANLIQCDIGDYWMEREGAIQLGVLPFYHIFAIFANMMASLAWGQTTVILPGFEPVAFMSAIQKYKVSLLFVVPPIILFMSKHPMVEKFDMSSVKRLISAAAPLGRQTEEAFLDKAPGSTIGQGFGMTETGPVIACSPVAHSGVYFGTAGTPVASTEAKYVDTDTGKECAAGEKGELWVRGPQNMKGYLNNPEATANTIDKDGWLHTGDIGYFEEGRLYVVDRMKELIKFKGLQVPPAELEALLCTHPAVADAGVIGVPDEEAGELPRAFVSLKPGAEAKAEELLRFVDEKVVSYKKLRGGLQIMEQIPRSAAGKILRRELKNLI